MALTMLDKKAVAADRSEWPAELKAEFERESRSTTAASAASFCRRPTRSASGLSGSRRASGSASTAMC